MEFWRFSIVSSRNERIVDISNANKIGIYVFFDESKLIYLEAIGKFSNRTKHSLERDNTIKFGAYQF